MSDRVGIEELLAWYRDAGVDEPLAERPLDRFEQSAAIADERARSRRTSRPVPEVEIATSASRVVPLALSEDAAAQQAQELAASCDDLASLKSAIASFEGCGLRETARNAVFAFGDAGASLAIVGGTPDRNEDAEGLPFAGGAGEMLERMLRAIGFARDDAYLLCASPWRTPGERALRAGEKAILAPFLHRHIELAKPDLVLTMGGEAAELLLGGGKRLPALRGRVHEATVGFYSTKVVVTFHPNVLAKQPAQKRLAWADLLLLKSRLSAAHDA